MEEKMEYLRFDGICNKEKALEFYFVSHSTKKLYAGIKP
jgi:hypothetical protein